MRILTVAIVALTATAIAAPKKWPARCPKGTTQRSLAKYGPAGGVEQGCGFHRKGEWVWLGPYRHLWETGKPRVTGSYGKNGREGEWISYHLYKGTVASKGRFVDDKEAGPWQAWHRDGQLAFEGSYVAGARDGAWRELHEDGKKKLEGSYQRGQPVGHHMVWHPSGALALDANYVGGALDGRVKFGNANGKLEREVDYRAGVLHGAWIELDDRGQRAREGTYKDGKREGLWVARYPNGKTHWEVRFKAGAVDGVMTMWSPDGKVTKLDAQSAMGIVEPQRPTIHCDAPGACP